MRVLVRVVRSAAPLRARLGLGVVVGALGVGAGVALMATSGWLISRAALRPPILSLAVAIVGVRFFGISRGVLRYVERLATHDAALRLLGRLRVTFFRRLEPLVPDGVGAGSRAGDLLGRFVADVDDLQHLFVRALGPPLVALLVGGGAAVAALLVSPAAALVLAVGLGVGAFLVPLAGAWIVRRSGRREAPVRSLLLAETLETLERSPELAVLGGTGEALRRVGAADGELRRARGRSALAESFGDALVTLLAGLTLAGVVSAAAPSVHSGAIDGALLGMLALLALSSFEAVRPLPIAARHLASSSAAAGRIFEVVDRAPPVREPADPAAAPAGLELRAEGVRVRYGEGPWVLDGVDLTLRRGGRVALVGPSGAGKTTLAHCLVRFRDVDEGRISIDGVDLRAYAPDDVRSAVLLVGQDAHLFATTIRENLRLARRDASDEDLHDALGRARLREWVASLPHGLETHVGEQGEQVSGGQRQRLALARAFLSRAPFVVFDEPTAHLDEENAAAIVADILIGAGDRGVLLITHRAHGLDLVDEVVSLR